MVNRLFVYGTLAPGESNEHILADLPGHWEPATARGTLYPNGIGPTLGYPAFVPEEFGPEVPGQIFHSDAFPEHWPRIDEFEGEGYQRTLIPVRQPDGTILTAYVYALRQPPLT